MPFFFVKTHKTGSSTVAALLRFGASQRGYRCFVPPVKLAGHVWSWEAPLFRHLLTSEVAALQERARNASRGGDRSFEQGPDHQLLYNCWTLHAVPSPAMLAHVMEPSPLVVTSVRDPLRRMISAWNHYRPNATASFGAWVRMVHERGEVRRRAQLTGCADDHDDDHDPHIGFNAMVAQLLPAAEVGRRTAGTGGKRGVGGEERVAEVGLLGEAAWSGPEALEAVVGRVRSGEWVAVIMERMEESLVVLQRRLGWEAVAPTAGQRANGKDEKGKGE